MSATILVAERLSQQFGGITAVNDLSFGLKQGEIVALIGPNGAGKTTLVNLMTGVHRPTIRPHSIRGAGRDEATSVRGCAPRARPHLPDRPAVSAHDGAGKRRRRRAVRRQAARAFAAAMAIAREQLEFTGLAQFADRPASALTLAGRKRLELAKSMAMRPKVLMLDEVNAGLNASEIDGALRLIRQIAERGVTILIIEHLMKVVMSLAQRVLVLHHGQLIAEGSATRSYGTRRWSKPISARNLPAVSEGVRWLNSLLTIEGLSAGYGERPRAVGCQPHRRER